MDAHTADSPLLIPGHPRYAEFWDKLEAATDADHCDGTPLVARRLLIDTDGIDVDETLAALAAIGGVCDCNILCEVDDLMSDAQMAAEIARLKTQPVITTCRLRAENREMKRREE